MLNWEAELLFQRDQLLNLVSFKILSEMIKDDLFTMALENVDQTLGLCFVITLFSVLYRPYCSYAYALMHVLPHVLVSLSVIPRSF